MTEPNVPKPVFICYAHKDNESSDTSKRWLDRVREHLEPLVQQESITVCSDQDIDLGDDWHAQIQEQLDGARVAVLLVSPAFLASDYIRNSELPVLLRNAGEQGLRIIPVVLRPCSFAETKFKYPDPKTGPQQFTLASLQAAGSPSKALSEMTEGEQDRALLKVAQTLAQLVGGTPTTKLDRTAAEPPTQVGTAVSYTLTDLLRSLVRVKEAFERFEAVGAPRTSESLDPLWAEIMVLRTVADLAPMDQFSRGMVHECINDLITVHRKHALALAQPAEAQDALPQAREALERFLALGSGHLDRLRARFAVLQGNAPPAIPPSLRKEIDRLLGDASDAAFKVEWWVPPPGPGWDRLDSSYESLNRCFETNRSAIADDILTTLLNQCIAHLDLCRTGYRRAHHPQKPEYLVNQDRLDAGAAWERFKDARGKAIKRMQEICPDIGNQQFSRTHIQRPQDSARPDEGQAGLEFRPLDAAAGGSQAPPADAVFGERAVARDTCTRLARTTASACETLLNSPSRQSLEALHEQFEPLFKFYETQGQLLDAAMQEHLARGVGTVAELLDDIALGIDSADLGWRQKALRFIDAAKRIGGT